ncbi:MAG TPA: DEAD/DEAH box helicase, partial [Planctomycetota bacterium]|nr:DEAD/DEAH box helicase [Planctomycetota bacterium]
MLDHVLLQEFHPAVRKWFETRLGSPTPPQLEGWPLIRAGKHTLIAAPTGSGKTLAAFLHAIDSLFSTGPYLPDETRVLYVSPLKALG